VRVRPRVRAVHRWCINLADEMKITAAIARRGAPFSLEECELAAPGADEILVRVLAAGICHTDLAVRELDLGVQFPAVLGHEGVGEVIALGEGVREFRPGDRVIMSFGSCGRCRRCEGGAPGYCTSAWRSLRGVRADGGSPITLGGEPVTGHFFAQSSFATHAVASVHNAVRIDDDLSPSLMAPLACGVQTGMGSVILALACRAEDTLAVFGCGTVGLAAVMAGAIVGCRTIVAVDLDESRLALAEALGATHVLDGNDPSELSRALRKLGGVSRALDTTARPEVMKTAFGALETQGVLVCAGVSGTGAAFPIDLQQLVFSGKTVRGTIEGDAAPRDFIPRMIAWHREGRLPLEKLVTTYAFADIDRAASDLRAGRVIKPVLRMEE
jgi:aryl-alcohol dehydrogenase